jgi:hypothetical protein
MERNHLKILRAGFLVDPEGRLRGFLWDDLKEMPGAARPPAFRFPLKSYDKKRSFLTDTDRSIILKRKPKCKTVSAIRTGL